MYTGFVKELKYFFSFKLNRESVLNIIHYANTDTYHKHKNNFFAKIFGGGFQKKFKEKLRVFIFMPYNVMAFVLYL